jgi:hypothetical protein
MHSERKNGTENARIYRTSVPCPTPFTRGQRSIALCCLALVLVTSCVVPFDTGAQAAAMALDEMDNLAYSMRNETAVLQAQIDSLSLRLRKTDSLLRWLANLTGNPIAEDINWSTFSLPTPPDTGVGTKMPPDGGRAGTKPPPDSGQAAGKIPPG